MKLQLTPCIAIGVENREETEKLYSEVFGFEVTSSGPDFTELKAGPLMLYLVEDGTRDIAFSFETDDDKAVVAYLTENGCSLDKEISARVGEPFVRDPNGHLFNIWQKKADK